MIRQSAPLQLAMVAYSCVGVSRVTIRLVFARIAEPQGSVVGVHLISPWRAHLGDHAGHCIHHHRQQATDYLFAELPGFKNLSFSEDRPAGPPGAESVPRLPRRRGHGRRTARARHRLHLAAREPRYHHPRRPARRTSSVATEEVIRAARDLLPDSGRSITSIAKLLGVSPGTLYNHIPDLRELRAGAVPRQLEAPREVAHHQQDRSQRHFLYRNYNCRRRSRHPNHRRPGSGHPPARSGDARTRRRRRSRLPPGHHRQARLTDRRHLESIRRRQPPSVTIRLGTTAN